MKLSHGLLSLIIACAFACALPADRIIYDLTNATEYFEEFIIKYQRNYTIDDNLRRFQIFKEQLKLYNELNSYNESIHGINKFTDRTPEECGDGCLGDDDADFGPCTIVRDEQLTGLIDWTLDYREKEVVSRVQDQGNCNSCWAFVSAGCLEGSYGLKHNQLLELSVKQLVDCLQSSGHCANSSTMRRTFKELIGGPKVELASDYPYEAKDTPCKYDPAKAKVKTIACTNFRLKNELKFKQALEKYGPIGLGIYMPQLTGYLSGIVTVKECPPPPATERVNHAVLLVGYGKENDVEYWIVKNSYGVDFGEEGYMRLKMGQNVCGLLNNNAATAAVA